jgi:hypothetical protein
MEFKKNIVFVGDSYCSCWAGPSPIPHCHAQQKDEDIDRPSWLDVAADKLELNLYSFGYAGRSWYYSRQQLFEHMEYDPKWIKSVDLMVFCHTDSSRYNTGNGTIGNEMLDFNYRPLPKDSEYKNKIDLAESLHRWVTDLIDYPYQDWAQEQWFHEIARTFKDIKQIHFNNYTFTTDKTSSILPGVIYTTPLVHISLGEATGTDAEVTKNFMTEDNRVNHFSPHNNRTLGNLVATTAQNYQPGVYSIDTSNFEIINPNATRWPASGFGTC